MQAIEFETHLENGGIQLPSSYQHWQERKQVKVIVLAAKQISLSIDALDYQKNIRDEWT